MYLNETTRHADVILPPPSQLQRSHYDVLAAPVRGAQRRQLHPAGAAARRRPAGRVGDHREAGVDRAGPGADADPAVVDDTDDRRDGPAAPSSDEHSNFVGRDPDELLDELDAVRPARPRAPARLHAPHRTVRRRVRIEPGRDVARRPARSSRTASTSAPSSNGCPGSCARRRQDRAGASGAHRRPGRLRGGDRRAGGEGHGARRPTPSAQQQLLDAQHRGAREGQAALHAACPSRRRGAPRARRRSAGIDHVTGRIRQRAGRGDRCDPSRCREPPARVGSRCGRARRCAWPPSTRG